MLSVPTMKYPRKVSIRVAKAEKLVLSRKENKKKNNSKFRVVVLGGKKKETSILVDDINGNPEWNFSCLIKLHRGKGDPVCLLVEDSEGHHKGQVVIPLVKIGAKPYTYSQDQSPATSNNIICSELEPTNKCSNATGFLIYWIWVEEFWEQEDLESKSSFKGSMSSIFGSMHVIGSAKSKPSATAGSVSNISSAMSLNKPESHKKTLSFLHIKSKKDKSKKSSSDYKLTSDSSDVESHIETGNPFEIDIHNNKQVYGSINGSFGSSDFHFQKPNNPFNSSVDPNDSFKINSSFPERFDGLSHGSHGSISESGSYSKFGEERKLADYQSNANKMSPITLLPSKPIVIISDNQIKSNPANQDSYHAASESSLNDMHPHYKPGHKATNDSDYSMFSNHSVTELPSTTIRMMNDEAEILRKENSDLKTQNGNYCHIISELKCELDNVKDTLYKLRSRLLLEGATEFLERL